MASEEADPRLVAFRGGVRIAAGAPASVGETVRRALQAAPDEAVLVFDARTGAVVDLDLRGLPEPRAPGEQPLRRGRPRLGVVAREVTLLPRHWEWLARQPGGASVTLRRLVEVARKAGAGVEAGLARREAAYLFMVVMGGDRPGFEEASRCLFAGDRAGLDRWLAPWPADVRDQIVWLLDGAEAPEAPPA